MPRYLPGDIALHGSHTFIGLGIQFGTRSRFNHVRLVIDEQGNTVEAEPRGASRGVIVTTDVVVRPPLSLAQRRRIRGLADATLGTPYGFLDVAALGLAQFGLVLPGVKRRIVRPDRLFCSQLVDYVWTEAGYHAFDDGRVPQNVSPGDLADLAFREGWPVIQGGTLHME